MLPTLVPDPPAGDGWAFEVKWDGIRAIVTFDSGTVRLISRNGNELSGQYPELTHIEVGPLHDAVLDGEIVAFDDSGRPSFQRLQQRMGVADGRWAASKSSRNPVVFLVFDVLWLDGRDLIELPYLERRELLAGVALPSDCWRLSDYHEGDGEAMRAATRAQGLEGLIAKRVDSVYEPGKRTRTWLKIKNNSRQEFAIVGYTPGEGNRQQTIGALLLGYHAEPGGGLVYAGKVGTGFSESLLKQLQALLEPETVPTPAFTGQGMPRQSKFVRPTLVAEVEFTEWTAGGMIRHPSFKGLRNDKSVDDIGRERPQ